MKIELIEMAMSPITNQPIEFKLGVTELTYHPHVGEFIAKNNILYNITGIVRKPLDSMSEDILVYVTNTGVEHEPKQKIIQA